MHLGLGIGLTGGEPSAAPVSGTIAQHVGGLRQSASGLLTFSGSAAQKLGGLVQSASGALTFSGSASQKLGGLVQSASGMNPAPPLAIAGCKLWLRADQGITVDGSNNVSQWNDLSGNGFNFSESISADRLAYHTSGFATNSTAYLANSNSGNQFITINNAALELSQPFTIIWVGSVTATASVQKMVSSSASFIGTNGTSNDFEISSGTVLASSTTVTSPCVVAFVSNGASSAGYVNNSSSAVVSGNAGAGKLTSNGILSIGGSLGSHAEVLVYNSALSTANLGTIFSYVATRYGISAS